MDANELTNLEKYEGKNGTLKLNSGEEVEGKLAGVTPFAVVINPKGSGPVRMVQPDDIASFDPEPEKAKTPKPKKMAPVEPAKVMQHLLDRHGVEIKAVVDQPQDALVSWHDSLHAEYVLGHHHNESDAEKAVAAAEGEQAGESESSEAQQAEASA